MLSFRSANPGDLDKSEGPGKNGDLYVNRKVSENRGCYVNRVVSENQSLKEQNITKRILSVTVTTMFYYHQSPTVYI